MAIRSVTDKDAVREANQRLDKLMGRAYLLWLFGVAVGLVKLKANKVSFSGIEYSIENPEVVQGLIFIACLICYVTILGIFILFSLQWSIPNRNIYRRMIYLAAGKKCTLKNRTTREILVLKKVARLMFKVATSIVLMIGLFPVLHIFLFERDALWIAIKAMFGDTL